MSEQFVTAALAASLAAVHLLAGRLTFLQGQPRRTWLSAAGGVSVSYVFLHLLPELHQGQHTLGQAGVSGWLAGRGDTGIYLVALAGLTIFYGLERLAMRSRTASRTAGAGDRTAGAAFAVHVGSFALYNMVVGYLLLHGERDNLPTYAAAMGLHFVVNDRALREHHKERYDSTGRWILAAAVLGGWVAALVVRIHEAAVTLLVALLAGGVILNVLKEELPQHRESRFSAFLAGAGVYGALLLAL
jgi:hypothetical protein